MRAKNGTSTPISFMGIDFPTLIEFQRQFPAYASEDAVRAIRSGCQTVMEVENYLWRRKNRQYIQQRDAARNSKFAARFAFGEG